MNTFLYILSERDELPDDRTNPWFLVYDCASGFIVEAESEIAAREIAANACGDEGTNAWLSPALSTCEELKPDGTSGIIMRDFHAG